MSNTIYVLFHDVGLGPSDFSYYSTYERARRALLEKDEHWTYAIVAVDEGEINE
jgi:hypothetical protein